MLFLRSFINLFMVPTVAFYIFLKKGALNDERLEGVPYGIEKLIKYCIIVVCNIPITRVFTVCIKILTGMNVEADSSYYTIAAIVAALIMPEMYFFIPKLNEKLKNDRTVENNNPELKMRDE